MKRNTEKDTLEGVSGLYKVSQIHFFNKHDDLRSFVTYEFLTSFQMTFLVLFFFLDINVQDQ